MALFKSRNNRRSSSTSYASTLTTLVFIAVCVLGIWMLTSNSVVPPQSQSNESSNIRTAIDNTASNDDFSSSQDSAETTTSTANSEDTPEITTKTSEESVETTTEGNEDLAETTTEGHEDLAETTTKVNEDLAETTIKGKEDLAETTAKGNEDSAETTTKSQDQKDTPVFGDNPGNLPDDAIKSDDKNSNPSTNIELPKEHSTNSEAQLSEESTLTQKQQVSETIEASSDDDQHTYKKNFESQKVQRSTGNEAAEGNQKDEEDHAKAQDDNSESQNANAGDNQEQNTRQQQEDARKLDTQETKNDEDELNKQQLRDDKGENAEKDQKQQDQLQKQDEGSELYQAEGRKENQNTQDDNQETLKPKKQKKKPSKLLPNVTTGEESKKSWSTQADQSQNQKKRQKDESDGTEKAQGYTWHLCNVTAGTDYIPCLDNEKALRQLHSTKHYEHRERHCPEDTPTCLVSLPKGYKRPIEWPNSRDKIWYHNVPHTKLAEVKGHQNWVKMSGEFLTFPGGGTQFIHGALHYIDFIQQAEAGIAWGKRTRVILDVGCGVGSFGGYLFERDVIAMSFAPKDEHEAQVQFALERGIPAISAVMGSQRLPFPSRVFDLVHCARCRVPWHADGGMLLLELNRVLRPGGYFVWSATPVYQKLKEDVEIWEEMSSLTKSLCWELVTINKDKLNSAGAAIYRKPTSNECYEQREQNLPLMCQDDDDPNAAWYVPLQACMHKVPVDKAERGARWPEAWPHRLQKVPYWLNNSQMGIYGKPASQDFAADNERWKNIVDEISNIGITWSNVRNVMDMRAVYGGFAAALRDLPVWVFNVVNVDSADTLPIIYERGLFGIYHDWCESFSTYPRTYDLLHADQLFSKLTKRCKLVPVLAEVDRIVRPGGKFIVRDEPSTIGEVEALLKSLHWEITFSKTQEGMLCAEKSNWRPDSVASS